MSKYHNSVADLLNRVTFSGPLQSLQTTTVLADQLYPELDHKVVKDWLKLNCDYNDLMFVLFQRAEKLTTTPEAKLNFSAKQKLFRSEWYITATKNAPWSKVRLDNHLSRLLNIIIEHIATVLRKTGAATPQ